jgi:hypothetical protein
LTQFTFSGVQVQQPWRMPKWLGGILGALFGLVALGAASLVVGLTRPAHQVVSVAPLSPAEAALVAPRAPAAHAASAPARVRSAPHALFAPKAAKHAKKDKRHGKSALAKHGKKGKATGKSAALAKRDVRTRSSVSAKNRDDVDKLLGL